MAKSLQQLQEFISELIEKNEVDISYNTTSPVMTDSDEIYVAVKEANLSDLRDLLTYVEGYEKGLAYLKALDQKESVHLISAEIWKK